MLHLWILFKRIRSHSEEETLLLLIFDVILGLTAQRRKTALVRMQNVTKGKPFLDLIYCIRYFGHNA